jgi:uncharacterized protein YoxC
MRFAFIARLFLGAAAISIAVPTSHALFLSKAKKKFDDGLKKVKKEVKKGADTVKGGIKKVGETITGGAKKVGETIKGGAKKVVDKAKTAFYNMGNKVKDAFQTVSNLANEAVKRWEIDGKAFFVETFRSIRLCKANKSFTQNVDTKKGETFTMLFSSDPQLPWWGPVEGAACPDGKGHDDCVLEKSRAANRDQVDAMNSVERLGNWPAKLGGNAVAKPKGLVINGDLTAFAHTWQWYLFEKYYNKSVGKGKALQHNAFFGLGNHDYSNNLNDCTGTVPQYLPYKSNGCAAFSVDYIRRMVNCGTVGNFKKSWVTSFDTKSLAYSFEIGDYHFVQLHNYPTFEISEKNLKVKKSIGWLKEDLASAARRGKKSVLNFHDASQREAIRSSPSADFVDAIAGKNVVAVFAGHIHEQWGYRGNVKNTQIPVFLSGSSDNRSFLLAEFGPNGLKVAVVRSHGGKPAFDLSEDSNAKQF